MGHIYAKAADSIYKTFFFKSKKFFFYDPHHSDKKRRPIAEFLTDFEKNFTFVIRITFLTNREVPRRIRERDLVQNTPSNRQKRNYCLGIRHLL